MSDTTITDTDRRLTKLKRRNKCLEQDKKDLLFLLVRKHRMEDTIIKMLSTLGDSATLLIKDVSSAPAPLLTAFLQGLLGKIVPKNLLDSFLESQVEADGQMRRVIEIKDSFAFYRALPLLVANRDAVIYINPETAILKLTEGMSNPEKGEVLRAANSFVCLPDEPIEDLPPSTDEMPNDVGVTHD